MSDRNAATFRRLCSGGLELVTANEAARLAGCSSTTIAAAVDRGELAALEVKSGDRRHLVLLADDARAFVARPRGRQPTSPRDPTPANRSPLEHS